MNLSPLVSRELQLRGTLRFSNEIDRAVQLLDADPRLEQVITHDFPAEQAVRAFATAADSNTSGKVLIALAVRLPRSVTLCTRSVPRKASAYGSGAQSRSLLWPKPSAVRRRLVGL